MNTVRVIFIFLMILFHYSPVKAQEDEILKKGRFSTSLYGFIESQGAKEKDGVQSRFSNSYIIGTKSGIFLKDRLNLGLNFSFNKSESNDQVLSNSDEQIMLGIWMRWYFLKYKDIALFADITPFFTSIHQDFRSISTDLVRIEQRGLGWGLSPGVGFIYFLNRNIGFSLNLDYMYSSINGTRENLVDEVKWESDFNVNQLRFSFGFQIILDEFFF